MEVNADAICPDCVSGEHHPSHEVSTIAYNALKDKWEDITCPCPCAELIHGPDILSPGETGYIFTGRYNDRNIHIHAKQGGMFVGAIINYDGNIKIVHVPTNWVRRLP